MRLPPGALLLGLLLAGCEPADPPPRDPVVPLRERMPPVDPERTVPLTLRVEGMTCSGCEYNVASALRLVAGVLEAEADHDAAEARVRYDPAMTTPGALAQAVRDTGYRVPDGGSGD